MRRTIPSKVAEFLGQKELINTSFRKIKKNESAEGLDELTDLVSQIIADIINPYYDKLNKRAYPSVFKFLFEPLKNANYYSQNHNDITFGIRMSKKGMIASYRDRGSYFHREDVKECYEKKIKHPEKFKTESNQIGYRRGTTILYEMADIICVDTDSGTLYTGLSIDSKFFESKK